MLPRGSGRLKSGEFLLSRLRLRASASFILRSGCADKASRSRSSTRSTVRDDVRRARRTHSLARWCRSSKAWRYHMLCSSVGKRIVTSRRPALFRTAAGLNAPTEAVKTPLAPSAKASMSTIRTNPSCERKRTRGWEGDASTCAREHAREHARARWGGGRRSGDATASDAHAPGPWGWTPGTTAARTHPTTRRCRSRSRLRCERR